MKKLDKLNDLIKKIKLQCFVLVGLDVRRPQFT